MRRSCLFILIFLSSIIFCPYLTDHLRSSAHVCLSVWSNEGTVFDTEQSVVTRLPTQNSHLILDAERSAVTSLINTSSHFINNTEQSVSTRRINSSHYDTVEWKVPVLNESMIIANSLVSDSQLTDNQNKQNGRRRRSTVSNKENLKFRPSKEPIDLMDTIQFLYDQVLYFSDHSTTISFELPFNDLLHSILTLYKFLNDLNVFTEMDALNFTTARKTSSDGQILATYRLYQTEESYAYQSGICDKLNLTHVSPFYVKNVMIPDKEYFLPVEIITTHNQVICKINKSTYTGLECAEKIFEFSAHFHLFNKFGGVQDLYDLLLTGPPRLSYVTVSSSRIQIVDTSSKAAVCCKGAPDREQDAMYLFLRFFGNEFYARLSTLYLSLTDTLFAHFLSLESVFFATLPNTLINNDIPTDRDKIIRAIQNFLPAPMPSFQPATHNTVSHYASQVLRELYLNDLPLMQFYHNLSASSYHFWNSHSTSSLQHLHFSFKTLHLSAKTSFEFFSDESPAAPIRFSLPFTFLVDSTTTPESYSQLMHQLTMRPLTDRELIFLYSILHNELVECLVHLRHYINVDIPDAPILSLTSILTGQPVTPPKRNVPLIYPSKLPPPSQGVLPSPGSTVFSNFTPTLSPPPLPKSTLSWEELRNETLAIEQNNRFKRNIWGSFWSNALSLPSADQISDLQESEKTLYQRELQVQDNVATLAKSTDKLQATITSFRSEFNQNTERTNQIEDNLIHILADERDIAEKLAALSTSVEAAVSTAVSFIQVNGALLQLVHSMASLSDSVSSLYTQSLPVHLLTDSKLTDLLPLYPTVSAAHALMRPSLRDSTHALDITFPVISDYFLAYDIHTVPFLPAISDSTSQLGMPVSHQFTFPYRSFAISPLQRYFTYDHLPCFRRQGSVVCQPTDVHQRSTNNTCFQKPKTDQFRRCNSQLAVHARYDTPQSYIYSSSRNYALIFTPSSINCTYACKQRRSVHRFPLYLAAGVTKLGLPYGCSVRTSELYIPSASVMPPSNQTLTFASQGEHFSDTLLSFHNDINHLHDINVTNLVSDIKRFNITMQSVPIQYIPKIVNTRKTIDSIQNLSPFSPDFSNSSSGVNWIQILFIVVMIFFLCLLINCIHCLCPGLFKALGESFSDLCCVLFCSCRKRTRPVNRDAPDSVALTPIYPRRPAAAVNWEPVLQDDGHPRHQVPLPVTPVAPPSYSPPAAATIPDVSASPAAADTSLDTTLSGTPPSSHSRRNSISSVFSRTFQRRSFQVPILTWGIVTFERRLRLRTQYKHTPLFYNTISKKICNELDIPFTHQILSVLPGPSMKLVAEYHARVDDLRAPDYVLKDGRYYTGSPPHYYVWSPDVRHWTDVVSGVPIDGLRPPIPF